MLDRLKEDFETVRLEALSCLETIYQHFIEQFTNESFALSEGVTASLNDALFLQACSMVSDILPAIRQVACRLIGKICGVQLNYLLQCFSRESSFYSLDSTTPASITLFPAEGAATGALIYALEDEYEAVRLEAVRAILQISLKNSAFAKEAIEILVDVFNDEIEQVRVETICAIHQIGIHHGSLKIGDEAVKSLKHVMTDVSPYLRKNLYAMIGICEFLNSSSLIQIVNELIKILLAAYYDRISIIASYYRIPIVEFLVKILIIDSYYSIL